MRRHRSSGPTLLVLVLLSGILAAGPACRGESPPAAPAAGVEGAPQPASAPTPAPETAPAPAPGAAEGSPGPSPPADPERHPWPGVDTDLHGAPALYHARSTRVTPLMRKAKDLPDVIVLLYPGYVVEVLADEGPSVTHDGERADTVVARFGDGVGWARKDLLERLPAPLPDLRAIWGEAAARSGAPPDCVPGAILADLHAAPGEELALRSFTAGPCERFLVVAGRDARDPGGKPLVLGWAELGPLEDVRALPWGDGPGFLVATAWFQDGSRTGSRRVLLRAPEGEPAAASVVFEGPERVIDATSIPAKYVLSRFAEIDPAGDRRWMMQWRLTERTTSPGGEETDTATERFFRFDGERFVPAERPAGVPDLPSEPKAIERGHG